MEKNKKINKEALSKQLSSLAIRKSSLSKQLANFAQKKNAFSQKLANLAKTYKKDVTAVKKILLEGWEVRCDPRNAYILRETDNRDPSQTVVYCVESNQLIKLRKTSVCVENLFEVDRKNAQGSRKQVDKDGNLLNSRSLFDPWCKLHYQSYSQSNHSGETGLDSDAEGAYHDNGVSPNWEANSNMEVSLDWEMDSDIGLDSDREVNSDPGTKSDGEESTDVGVDSDWEANSVSGVDSDLGMRSDGQESSDVGSDSEGETCSYGSVNSNVDGDSESKMSSEEQVSSVIEGGSEEEVSSDQEMSSDGEMESKGYSTDDEEVTPVEAQPNLNDEEVYQDRDIGRDTHIDSDRLGDSAWQSNSAKQNNSDSGGTQVVRDNHKIAVCHKTSSASSYHAERHSIDEDEVNRDGHGTSMAVNSEVSGTEQHSVEQRSSIDTVCRTRNVKFLSRDSVSRSDNEKPDSSAGKREVNTRETPEEAGSPGRHDPNLLETVNDQAASGAMESPRESTTNSSEGLPQKNLQVNCNSILNSERILDNIKHAEEYSVNTAKCPTEDLTKGATTTCFPEELTKQGPTQPNREVCPSTTKAALESELRESHGGNVTPVSSIAHSPGLFDGSSSEIDIEGYNSDDSGEAGLTWKGVFANEWPAALSKNAKETTKATDSVMANIHSSLQHHSTETCSFGSVSSSTEIPSSATEIWTDPIGGRTLTTEVWTDPVGGRTRSHFRRTLPVSSSLYTTTIGGISYSATDQELVRPHNRKRTSNGSRSAKTREESTPRPEVVVARSKSSYKKKSRSSSHSVKTRGDRVSVPEIAVARSKPRDKTLFSKVSHSHTSPSDRTSKRRTKCKSKSQKNKMKDTTSALGTGHTEKSKPVIEPLPIRSRSHDKEKTTARSSGSARIGGKSSRPIMKYNPPKISKKLAQLPEWWTIPPGTVPPGTIPPGTVPPGTVPPGTVPPGTVPPGTVPPGTVPPGTVPPGTVPPGTIPPGTIPPGTIPTPRVPRGKAVRKSSKKHTAIPASVKYPITLAALAPGQNVPSAPGTSPIKSVPRITGANEQSGTGKLTFNFVSRLGRSQTLPATGNLEMRSTFQATTSQSQFVPLTTPPRGLQPVLATTPPRGLQPGAYAMTPPRRLQPGAMTTPPRDPQSTVFQSPPPLKSVTLPPYLNRSTTVKLTLIGIRNAKGTSHLMKCVIKYMGEKRFYQCPYCGVAEKDLGFNIASHLLSHFSEEGLVHHTPCADTFLYHCHHCDLVTHNPACLVKHLCSNHGYRGLELRADYASLDDGLLMFTNEQAPDNGIVKMKIIRLQSDFSCIYCNFQTKFRTNIVHHITTCHWSGVDVRNNLACGWVQCLFNHLCDIENQGEDTPKRLLYICTRCRMVSMDHSSAVHHSWTVHHNDGRFIFLCLNGCLTCSSSPSTIIKHVAACGKKLGNKTNRCAVSLNVDFLQLIAPMDEEALKCLFPKDGKPTEQPHYIPQDLENGVEAVRNLDLSGGGLKYSKIDEGFDLVSSGIRAGDFPSDDPWDLNTLAKLRVDCNSQYKPVVIKGNKMFVYANTVSDIIRSHKVVSQSNNPNV